MVAMILRYMIELDNVFYIYRASQNVIEIPKAFHMYNLALNTMIVEYRQSPLRLTHITRTSRCFSFRSVESSWSCSSSNAST